MCRASGAAEHRGHAHSPGKSLQLTAAREMYEPFHKLKYSFAAPYFDQMRTTLPKLVKDKGAKKVCTIYQDDDFGLEVMRGGEAGLKTIGMDFAEKTTFKRGATDFSSQVATYSPTKRLGSDLSRLSQIEYVICIVLCL
jgi:ABC-type branched-subunit amino acid transport system substrate-binding protein